MKKSSSLDQGADSQVRNLAANGLTAHAESFCFRERHFSAISVKNSKACHISSLSAESQRIAMKVPTLALPLMTG
jgi:hypothetical protein